MKIWEWVLKLEQSLDQGHRGVGWGWGGGPASHPPGTRDSQSPVESCQVNISIPANPYLTGKKCCGHVGFSLIYDLLMERMKFSLKQTAVSHSFVTFLIYILKH